MAFSLFKPKNVTVDPSGIPSPSSLSFGDKAMALGAILQGDTNALQQLQMLAAARDQAMRQKALDNEFMAYATGKGLPALARTPRPDSEQPSPPEAPNIPSLAGLGVKVAPMAPLPSNIPDYSVTYPDARSGPPTLRDAIPLLLKRRAAGIDIRPDIELLDKAGPQVDYVNGVRVDRRAGDGPGFIPQFDKGQEPVYNGRGEIIGVRNMDGSIKAAADMAGAVQGAQEQAKAGWDLVDVEINGKPIKLPRAVAAPLLAQAFGEAHPGGLPAGFGEGLSPGERAAQESAGRAEGEGGAKARLDLPTVTARANQSITLIDDLLKDPNLKSRVGVGGVLPALPNTPGPGVDAKLDQLQGATFLQAYNDLKGAGQITEIEGAKAENAIARLKRRDQSYEDYTQALTDLRDVLSGSLQRAQQRAATTGAPAPASAPQAAVWTPDQARAELARRRAAKAH